MKILAIDPGNDMSAWALTRTGDCQPLAFGKQPNSGLLEKLHCWDEKHSFQLVAVEMVASYGMPVGREVFDTCVWIGRYLEAAPAPCKLVFRRDVKLHLCHDSRAKDTNIRQALVDRFALGEPNYGKGTKKAPGWFYGFSADVWQAYALAVCQADLIEGRPA